MNLHSPLSLTLFSLTLLLGLAACGPTGPDEPSATPDAGVRPSATDAGARPDAGASPDAGPAADAGPTECPEGYQGPRCDQCAPGYQDGNADGVCSLACDATGHLAPDCGHGRCFIDTTIDARACACEEGYVGTACDQCDVGYADLTGSGECVRTCQLDCGPYGACEVNADDSESCVCNRGYEGEVCEICAAGFVPAEDGSCGLDRPDTAGLELWLDATEAASIELARGGGVGAWRDHRRLRDPVELTASPSARQPEYVEQAIAGLPAIRFDGVDDVMSVPGFEGFGGQDYTVFVLVHPHTRTPGGVFSLDHGELGAALGLDLYAPGTRFVHGLPGMPNVRDVAESSDFAAGVPMVLGVRRWTSGLLDHIRLFGRLDGDPLGVEVDDNILSVGDLGALNLRVGVGPNGDRLAGDLGEVLVYRRALEDTEMQRVLEYLAAKWDVP